jgi:hypothetical protein
MNFNFKKIRSIIFVVVIIGFLGFIYVFASTGILSDLNSETNEEVTDDVEEITEDTLEEFFETEAETEAIDEESITWQVDEITDEFVRLHGLIENPTSKALLSTYLVLPITGEDPRNEKYPVLFQIPGGTDWGTNALTDDLSSSDYLLPNGIGYAYFDPDGRGESKGDEDANGPIQQDGLFAVSEAIANHPSVDTNDLAILSYSYGTTLASGMLSRYENEHPYKWYLDWEGPSKREYTTKKCTTQTVDKNLQVSCDDDEFWAERESATFLANLNIPYLRLQNTIDHVQESNEHAVDAINAATNGTSPWTRINNEDPNQTYTYDSPPEYLEKRTYQTLEYALEMFEMF